MAIGDTLNQTPFGKDYNAEEEERKQAGLATQNAMMGAGSPAPDSNMVAQVPGIENIRNPGAFNPALNQEVAVGSPSVESDPSFISRLSSILYPSGSVGGSGGFGLPPTFTPSSAGATQAEAGTDTSPITLESLGLESSGQRILKEGLGQGATTQVVQEQGPSIPQGSPGSPQANFVTRMENGKPLNTQEVQDANALAASMGTTFNPATGYSREAFNDSQAAPINPPMTGMRPIDSRTGEPLSQQVIDTANRIGLTLPEASVPLPQTPQTPQAQTYSQEETLARLGGRTLNEYLNAPPVRTPGISGLKTDPQGRMIPNVEESQPQPNVAQPPVNNDVPAAVAQPPASALSPFEQASLERQQRIGGTGSFEGDSAAREARLRANERQPGESQAGRDTRVAQSRTTGGQTEGMSFDDARIQARGQLAARGIKDPSVSMVNDLARGMQAGEPERPGFKGNVYTVNGVTFAQTSREGAQVIDTGTKTPEEVTREAQKFEFTSQKIKEAREAYLAGDVTKANDILTSAEIKQYGTDATADEFFAGSTPSATNSGLTQQQQEANITRQEFDTMEEAEAANLGKGTKITIGGRNATV